MTRFFKHTFLACLCVFTFSCQNNAAPETEAQEIPEESNSGGPLEIVAANSFIADAVRIIGGENISLYTLSSTDLSEADYQKMKAADWIFYNSVDSENPISDTLKNWMPTTRVADLAEGFEERFLIDDTFYTGDHDPNFRMDIGLWQDACEEISEKLLTKRPQQRAIFTKNFERYLNELDSLNLEIKAAVSEIPEAKRILVTQSNSMAYFARRFGFQYRSFDKYSMDELVGFCVENQVPAVFYEAGISKENLGSLIKKCAEREHQMKIAGPLFTQSLSEENGGTDSYLEMMWVNTEKYVERLK